MSNVLGYPLDKLKEVIEKWLILENLNIVDVITAVYVANKFDSDPLWLLLIAPHSNAKTELLRGFDGHKDAYFISNITPSTLVSGQVVKCKRPEPSLLPKLNDKLVIMKDFTTILSMRSEQQQEILAQLREAYDGKYTKIFGNGKEITWEGRFGLVGACTPVYDNHYGVIGSMGERFILYRTDTKNGYEMGMQAQRVVGQEKKMREEIKTAMHRFISQFESLDNVHIETSEDIKQKIVNLACFCAYARCPVERDRYDRTIKYEPLPEGPARLVKQLIQIGAAIALVNEKHGIDNEVYQTVKKIGRDLVPMQRIRIIKNVWGSGATEINREWIKIVDVAEAINMPGATVKILLEDLMAVGIMNRKLGEPSESGGRPPWLYQTSEKACSFIFGGEVFTR